MSTEMYIDACKKIRLCLSKLHTLSEDFSQLLETIEELTPAEARRLLVFLETVPVTMDSQAKKLKKMLSAKKRNKKIVSWSLLTFRRLPLFAGEKSP